MALRMRHHEGVAMAELRFEPCPFRLRADRGGRTVVDSTRAALVWEPRRLVPSYAVPIGDVVGGVSASQEQPPAPDLSRLPPMLGPTDFGLHTTAGLVADVAGVPGAGFLPEDPDLSGMVVLDFASFDGWRTEEEPVMGHAHDPFKRIEVLTSSRRIEVRLDGTLLASTDRPRLLLETYLPQRWYLPVEDVRMDLLVTSDHTTQCAYKGEASYFSTADGSPGGRDIAWTYQAPLHDAATVQDYVCFWAERTDVTVDGQEQRRPVTPWSRPEEQRAASPDRLEFG